MKGIKTILYLQILFASRNVLICTGSLKIADRDLTEIPQQHKDLFKTIGEIAESINQKLYVVGGYVRDYYLNQTDAPPTDIEFVTVGLGIKMAQEIARKLVIQKVSIFKQFGTAQVKYHDLELEFVGARKESYRRDSRKPLVENGTLKDDQLRRDFTINALSWASIRMSSAFCTIRSEVLKIWKKEL